VDSAAELEAARLMQRRLVPDELPSIPGCSVEACYHPAAEVGGDFYQVLALPDGAYLLVIGDVSGKGLRAAMTGILVIGALRAVAARGLGPAEVLVALNEALLESNSDGFVTCLCLHLDPSGEVRIANAGHLAPYRNHPHGAGLTVANIELPVDFGFPLGIVPDAEYSETTLELAPGDTLTLLTDGVLEARNAEGELFGFERTAAISGTSADQIAKTAELFGQEDDITVLTLAFAPAEVTA
jgi:serine phosphatase RsbU (regulator of sigma subunit)